MRRVIASEFVTLDGVMEEPLEWNDSNLIKGNFEEEASQ